MDENRILFVNGQVFDGTGSPPVPADVVVRGDRIESVRPGGGTEIQPNDRVVDCGGATVMHNGCQPVLLAAPVCEGVRDIG